MWGWCRQGVVINLIMILFEKPIIPCTRRTHFAPHSGWDEKVGVLGQSGQLLEWCLGYGWRSILAYAVHFVPDCSTEKCFVDILKGRVPLLHNINYRIRIPVTKAIRAPSRSKTLKKQLRTRVQWSWMSEIFTLYWTSFRNSSLHICHLSLQILDVKNMTSSLG